MAHFLLSYTICTWLNIFLWERIGLRPSSASSLSAGWHLIGHITFRYFSFFISQMEEWCPSHRAAGRIPWGDGAKLLCHVFSGGGGATLFQVLGLCQLSLIFLTPAFGFFSFLNYLLGLLGQPFWLLAFHFLGDGFDHHLLYNVTNLSPLQTFWQFIRSNLLNLLVTSTI